MLRLAAGVAVFSAFAVLTGCRIGVYTGSLHGRGTVASEGASTTNDASVAAGAHEIGMDVVSKRFSILSSMGYGTVKVRVRETETSLTERGDSRELRFGLGAGVSLWRSNPFRIGIFGAATKSIIEDDLAQLSTRYMVGVQLDVSGTRSDDFDGVGGSIRLAYVAGSGAVDGMRSLDVGAILFQIGLWMQFEGPR